MKMSTKAQSAVTASLSLALHYKEGPLNVADLSAEQGISVSYLEQLFAYLRRQGLVQVVRDPGGGYILTKPATDISLADIVAAVDGSDGSNRRDVLGQDRNPTNEMWDFLDNTFQNFLRGITLEDVVQRRRRAGSSASATASAIDERVPDEIRHS